MLHYCVFLGWAAEHFKSDSLNLARMFLCNSVHLHRRWGTGRRRSWSGPRSTAWRSSASTRATARPPAQQDSHSSSPTISTESISNYVELCQFLKIRNHEFRFFLSFGEIINCESANNSFFIHIRVPTAVKLPKTAKELESRFFRNRIDAALYPTNVNERNNCFITNWIHFLLWEK